MTKVGGGMTVQAEPGTPEFLLLGGAVCPGLREATQTSQPHDCAGAWASGSTGQ